jgi:hypothetical protein
MAEVCCQCETDVSTGTMKVKRKKLRGCTTEKAHEMMDKLSFNKFKRNVSSLLTNEDLICYKCNKRLRRSS